MQPILTRSTTIAGLIVVAIVSTAVLLYVSITREFLPGIVELTTALFGVLIFIIITLVPRRTRHAMRQRLNNVGVDKVGFVAAAVVVLAVTAVLAIQFERFPWPAPLILVALLLTFVVRGNGDV
ncbi:MAG: hypothetical protein HQ477_09145 [Chloroflexi bacterium]|nr:hypothetical protein [Chloroflexota bacterium]